MFTMLMQQTEMRPIVFLALPYNPLQYGCHFSPCPRVTLVTNNQIEVLVPHEECAVPRRRSKSPPGVFLETSLAVAFHPDFTTADDRIFHFRCFHQRTSKDHQGTGSPTEPPQEASWTPSCSYTVRKWPNGPLVGTVVLGQTVFHQWSCDNQKDNCLVVRSCSVVAGETTHELIGADGCSKNTKILPHLTYFNPVSCERREWRHLQMFFFRWHPVTQSLSGGRLADFDYRARGEVKSQPISSAKAKS
ncbi:hypothetical protein ANCDUO_06064 [Ancylostoma duodenale]|uniref:ZP domain-containing protein n=1 Tax=Ancylostoma duodenale TaxID=51022 RepID=A0A0C2GX39_9BILA|nr:hypothetical protein ANCDUO_06064 [Ancylostoma duodenale]